MTTGTVESAGDAHPARLRALYDRILQLEEHGLAMVEQAVGRAEAALKRQLGTTRIVAGATITDRPDLVYAAQTGGPVTVQSPEPDHPAELAKEGGAPR